MKLKKIRKNNKGFTLIEMVIVITIIGLLTSVAVTKYDKVQQNAKLNADYATAANLATAVSVAINDGLDDGITPITTEILLKKGYIQFEPKSKSVPNKSFSIVNNKDTITVRVGDDIFYPKPEKNKVD